MELQEGYSSKECLAFCRLLFSHRDLSVYESLWSLCTFHNFSWADLMDMIPWEFEGILSLMGGYMETQELKHKAAQAKRGG